jgi:hypothetical protein
VQWKNNARATRVAQDVFSAEGYVPEVRSNEAGVYQLTSSPYGRVELVRLKRGFAAAAEAPPAPCISPARLPKELAAHFHRNNLVPWRVIVSNDVLTAIRHLATVEAGATPDPRFCAMATSVDLIGENRQACAERLGAAIAAAGFPGPLAQLNGIDSIGKRTMVAVMARRRRWRLRGELPLGRFAIDRALENPFEGLFDLLPELAETLEPDDLIAVTDVELLAQTDRTTSALVLRELARLPRVVLLARPPASTVGAVLSLECPSLESADDARTLLRSVYGESLVFAGTALEMLLRAATVDALGIIPGRLLFLVRLARSLLGNQGEQLRVEAEENPASDPEGRSAARAVLAPDEIAPAIQLACSTWDDDNPLQR